MSIGAAPELWLCSLQTVSRDLNRSTSSRFLQTVRHVGSSAETVRDLLLPLETAVHDERLPVDSASCRESQQKAVSAGN